MANKKITELVQATSIVNTDLLLLETANGTRSIAYQDLKKPIDDAVADAAKPHPFDNNAAAHNGIFRGKDLTSLGVNEICSRISNGSFEDLYIGDYFDITISTSYGGSEVVRCILAGFDTYLNNGDMPLTQHHAVIVPKNCFKTTAKMNSTNTTAVSANTSNPSDKGAYLGSDMHQIVLPVYASAISSAIGATHLLSRKSPLSNAMTPTIASMAGNGWTGASSGWEWTTVQLQLLSEIQVYGANVFSSSFYDTGCDNFQLPLFALNPAAKVCKAGGVDDVASSNKQWWWLKAVASASYFANVYSNGSSYYNNASNSNGVRPLFCIG